MLFRSGTVTAAPPPPPPPVILVDTPGIQEAGGNGCGAGGHTVRGKCLSEIHTVREVVRMPVRGGGPGGLGVSGYREVAVGEERVSGREVAAILVLSAFPRLLAGSVLAHEATHAFFRLAKGRQQQKFPDRLDPAVEEGVCQLLACLWLEEQQRLLQQQEQRTGGTAADAVAGAWGGGEARLARYLAWSIANDPSDDYGGGYRAARAAYDRHGLEAVLEHVSLTGQLPC